MARFTEEQIKNAVIEGVAETYDKDASEITPETNYNTLGVSSVKVMQIIMYTEENLNIDGEIEFDDVAQGVTVGATIEAVTKRLAG
jgi:acyl carrier protein